MDSRVKKNMPIEDKLEATTDSIQGIQISPEALEKGELSAVGHVHKGKEPSIGWQYDIIQLAAKAAGVKYSKFAFLTCSDDVNDEAKLRSIMHGNAYDLINPGAPAYFDRLQVGFHSGHKRNVIVNFQHIGMYKNPTTGLILFGKVKGDEDGVIRPCCGMLDGMLKMISNGEKVPDEFAHLNSFGQEIKETDFSNPQQYSSLMWAVTLAHMSVQTETIIDGLTKINSQNSHYEKYVLAEGISINRQKYPHTGVLRGLYIIEGTKVHDLSKAAYKTVDSVATEMLANKID